MNNIVSVGTSHHIAPIEFREKLAFSEEQLIESLHNLRNSYHLKEAVILSTCNRVEVYAVANSQMISESPTKTLIDFLSHYHRIGVDMLKKWSYLHQNIESIQHLFRVTSSLDSMVVGESQILGQVKEAYDISRSAGGSGTILNRLFTKAFSVGKRIRTETTIASGAVSISYAAVELAKKIFNSLEDKTVAIIGAGEMSELTAKHLVTNGVSKVIVANRTYERAVKLADKFKGTPVSYDEDLSFLIDADIVISSTEAPTYMIKRKQLAEIMKKRKHQYMFLIDIAVPRDIEPDVNKINHAFLYNIDDLEAVVASNIKDRHEEAYLAEQIVTEEAQKFHDQLQIFEVNPTIKALHQQFQEIADVELQECLNLTELSNTQETAITSMAHAIVKKLLHHPIQNLRNSVNDGNTDHTQYVHTLKQLFALDEKYDKEQE
ncbi:glutamyl-tRNA reductase [Candidatus Poribacteria bacterium]|nr:MAG: glutamyl-tRNA reductase [Candidatus Poribacteria bacterium]